MSKTVVELEYFKPSGKFKYEGFYESDKEHTWKIIEEVKRKAENNDLPGISSGSWNGFIYINPLEGYPTILNPDK